MSVLEIRKFPDPILKEQCSSVTEFGPQLHRLLDDMRETMYAAEGIGLAAPQIGEKVCVAVVDIGVETSELIELINPVVLTREGKTSSEEGCLSIPRFRETIERAKGITLSAQDRHGKPFELEADGLLSVCIQHEIDHLNGILFVDHLSRLKRELFRRWLKKNMQNES